MALDLTGSLAQYIRPEWTVTVAWREQMTAVERAALAELDEPALVAACLTGQREAFDIVVERHRRPVYQVCYRFMGNHEDASDLAQDVFIRAFRGLHRFRGESALSTWLYRIVFNTAISYKRKRKPAFQSIENNFESWKSDE